MRKGKGGTDGWIRTEMNGYGWIRMGTYKYRQILTDIIFVQMFDM